MTKLSAKNTIILINGYNFSSHTTAYETEEGVNPIDVTGFTDGCKNSIPGELSASMKLTMLWDSTANSVHAALYSMPTGHVTIIPEGYTLGTPTLSLPIMQGNYKPHGEKGGAIGVGTLDFHSYGDNEGIEHGHALAHATITNTTTGTGYQVNSGAVTARCDGVIHVWTPTTDDTYVVKIQHCATVDGSYADLVTFTVNGKTRTSERVTAASGTINKFLRVLATRTGSAGDSFGFSVHYWQSV